MLNKIKIGPKLIGGFLIVSAIAAFIGIVGVVNIKTIDDADTILYEKMTVPISILGDINPAFRRIGTITRDMVRYNDPSLIAEEAKKCDDLTATINSNFEEFEKLIITDDLKKLYDNCITARITYREDLVQAIQLAKANKDAEAYALIDGHARETGNAYQAAIDKLQELQIKVAEKTADNNTKTANSATMMMTIALIIGVIVSIFLGVFLTMSITRPLGKVVTSANQIAQQDLTSLGNLANSIANGDTSKNLTIQAQELNINSEDEIGILAHSFNSIIAKLKESGASIGVMCETLRHVITETNSLAKLAVDGKLDSRGNASSFNGAFKEIIDGLNNTLAAVASPIGEASTVLEKVAARNLTARMQGNYNGDFAKIKNSVNLAVDNIDEALQQVSTGTEQVSSASQQISAGSQSLAQGSSEQASSLEEVSSSLEEMSSMTKQNAQNANEAKVLAGEANNNADQGKQAMGRMSIAINKIKDSSDQTAKIVKTIDEIAMQTNLLALNAAVEAARAGEAGRGFAVVAEEVRNLAQRSAQAAKNTADMIEESVRNAEEGVLIAVDVSKSFESIAGGNKKVNDLIAEIAAASNEQAQGIDQVNNAVAQMDKVTQQNAANSEESASAAEELSSQAEELQNMVSQFQLSQQNGNAIGKRINTVPEKHAGQVIPINRSGNKNGKSVTTRKGGTNKQSTIVTAEDISHMDEEILQDF
jgi:methyl-accepting chemotaxis protein